MRLDHIVILVEKDALALRALKETVKAGGYPYDPESGPRGLELRSSRINIGDEYLEIVQVLRQGVKTWNPQWTSRYDQGKRGAFCLFFEMDDAERAAVALKKAGVAAEGPSTLTYPSLMGLRSAAAPYFFYSLPAFPGTHLQIALMQYNRPDDRISALNALTPNAQRSGVNGIRRVEILLPDLSGSLPLLEKVFSGLEQADGCYQAMAEKTRLAFAQSADESAALRLFTITSQRSMLGKQFHIENVEVITTGG